MYVQVVIGCSFYSAIPGFLLPFLTWRAEILINRQYCKDRLPEEAQENGAQESLLQIMQGMGMFVI
jgi:hypothetical protein